MMRTPGFRVIVIGSRLSCFAAVYTLLKAEIEFVVLKARYIYKVKVRIFNSTITHLNLSNKERYPPRAFFSNEVEHHLFNF